MGRTAITDAELIAASRRGDATAFGEIVDRYQRAVSAVSYSGTGDRTLSEDVAQDTFVTAWRQLSALREIERLPAWLCGIARNLARAARRRRGREVPIDDHDVVATDSPFDAVSDREADQVVAAALERVPERYREPLVLFYCEHQSVKAVAQALGISEQATHQRLSRGRQHLADGVTGLVERTLERRNTKRNLAAAVVAAIAVIGPSQVKASTTTTKATTTTRGKGLTMLKIAAAIAVVSAVAGTGYLSVRTSTDPARSQPTSASAPTSGSSPGSVQTVTRTTQGPTPPALPAQLGTTQAQAGTVEGIALDCPSVARHMTDLAVQTQPDLLRQSGPGPHRGRHEARARQIRAPMLGGALVGEVHGLPRGRRRCVHATRGLPAPGSGRRRTSHRDRFPMASRSSPARRSFADPPSRGVDFLTTGHSRRSSRRTRMWCARCCGGSSGAFMPRRSRMSRRSHSSASTAPCRASSRMGRHGCRRGS